MTHLATQQSESVMSSNRELKIEDVIPVIDDIKPKGRRFSHTSFAIDQNLLGTCQPI